MGALGTGICSVSIIHFSPRSSGFSRSSSNPSPVVLPTTTAAAKSSFPRLRVCNSWKGPCVNGENARNDFEPCVSTSNPNETVQSLCLFKSRVRGTELHRSHHAVPRDERGAGRLRGVHAIDLRRAPPRGSIGLLLSNHLLDMLVVFEKLLNAMKVFNQMPLRDAFSWNVLIGGYGQAGFLNESVNFYEKMIRAGVTPDIYMFPCVLRCCGGLLDSKTGKEIYAHVIRFGYGSEVDVCNALITMYSKCSDLAGAWKVFDGMFTKDSISWNAIIAGYFGNGRFNEGIELFRTKDSISWSRVYSP